jgi:hypothetical protein
MAVMMKVVVVVMKVMMKMTTIIMIKLQACITRMFVLMPKECA